MWSDREGVGRRPGGGAGRRHTLRRGQRVPHQRVPGRPHQLLDSGLRGLRHPRDAVEACLQSRGARPSRTGDRERRATRPHKARRQIALRPPSATGHALHDVRVVGQRCSHRLPVRPPALGIRAGRPDRRDQERAGQPPVYAGGEQDSDSRLAQPSRLRRAGRHQHRPARCLHGRQGRALLLQQGAQLPPDLHGAGAGGGRDTAGGEHRAEHPVHPWGLGEWRSVGCVSRVGQCWGEGSASP